MKLKLCGMRRLEDIEMANRFCPDYVGFILSQPYRRYVDLDSLKAFHEKLNQTILAVGVFVNEEIDYILARALYLNVIQLHGDEGEDFITQLRDRLNTSGFLQVQIWKAVRVKSPEDITRANRLSVDMLLLDSFDPNTYGGSGKVGRWDLIDRACIEKPFFLAGGLSAENLLSAMQIVRPDGVDISSGIETDGWKDETKMEEITRLFALGKEESL